MLETMIRLNRGWCLRTSVSYLIICPVLVSVIILFRIGHEITEVEILPVLRRLPYGMFAIVYYSHQK